MGRSQFHLGRSRKSLDRIQESPGELSEEVLAVRRRRTHNEPALRCQSAFISPPGPRHPRQQSADSGLPHPGQDTALRFFFESGARFDVKALTKRRGRSQRGFESGGKLRVKLQAMVDTFALYQEVQAVVQLVESGCLLRGRNKRHRLFFWSRLQHSGLGRGWVLRICLRGDEQEAQAHQHSRDNERGTGLIESPLFRASSRSRICSSSLISHLRRKYPSNAG